MLVPVGGMIHFPEGVGVGMGWQGLGQGSGGEGYATGLPPLTGDIPGVHGPNIGGDGM